MSQSVDMRVTKRSGDLEDVSFDKILKGLDRLSDELHLSVDFTSLTNKVIDQLYDTIETSKIDELTSEQCATMAAKHIDYSTLSSRLIVLNHHKNTDPCFYTVMKRLYYCIDMNGSHRPIICEDAWVFIEKNAEDLAQMIDYSRDFLIDFFGYKTLERSYLFRLENRVVERIQHMWLRVSIGIHLKVATLV